MYSSNSWTRSTGMVIGSASLDATLARAQRCSKSLLWCSVGRSPGQSVCRHDLMPARPLLVSAFQLMARPNFTQMSAGSAAGASVLLSWSSAAHSSWCSLIFSGCYWDFTAAWCWEEFVSSSRLLIVGMLLTTRPAVGNIDNIIWPGRPLLLRPSVAVRTTGF